MNTEKIMLIKTVLFTILFTFIFNYTIPVLQVLNSVYYLILKTIF